MSIAEETWSRYGLPATQQPSFIC